MNITVEGLETYVQGRFGVGVDVFVEALKLSPNAEGYILGSVSEYLLKGSLEGEGCTVERIKEKWEGPKHRNHHGDFYFMPLGEECWFVLESKGVKSNSEKWHSLYNRSDLVSFLKKHSNLIPWISDTSEVDLQVGQWIDENLPEMSSGGKYADKLYSFQEVRKYAKPERTTPKSEVMAELELLTEDELNARIDERLQYVMGKIRVLETHFVSGTSASGNRTQATPRRDEFNVVAVDMHLRTGCHDFLYADPLALEPSSSDADHLQQNYVIGFYFPEEDRVAHGPEWSPVFTDLLTGLDRSLAVDDKDRQADSRWLRL